MKLIVTWFMILALAVTVSAQDTAQPGDWTGTAEFGTFILTVNPQGTGVPYVEFTLSGFKCGGTTQSGTVANGQKTGWDGVPIMNGEFIFEGSTIQLLGIFEGDRAFGDWYLSDCSGTWTAVPATSAGEAPEAMEVEGTPVTVEGIELQVSSVTRQDSYSTPAGKFAPNSPEDSVLVIKAKTGPGDLSKTEVWNVFVTDNDGRESQPGFSTTTAWATRGEIVWVMVVANTADSFILHLPGEQVVDLTPFLGERPEAVTQEATVAPAEEDTTASPADGQTEEYTTDNGLLTISYPADWLTKDIPSSDSLLAGVQMSTSAEVLAHPERGPAEAESMIVVIVRPPEAMDTYGMQMDSDFTPADIVATFGSVLGDANGNMAVLGEAETITLDEDFEVGYITTDLPQFEGALIGYAIPDEGWVFMFVNAHPGEYSDELKQTALDITASIRFGEAENTSGD